MPTISRSATLANATEISSMRQIVTRHVGVSETLFNLVDYGCILRLALVT
jgi:hypothetical protein